MRNVQIEKFFLLSFNDLYDDDDFDPSAALKDLPQTQSLEFISYLLHLYNIRKRADSRFQSHHLLQWMMQMENDDKTKVGNFIHQKSSLIFDPSFKLIDRRPCLDLIQHILVFTSPFDNPLNKSHYSILFRCLLYFNSLENKAQEKLFNWDEKGNIEQFADHILIVQTRNIEHERFKEYVLQFLKVYYFFSFCESHSKYSAYLNLFLSSIGLSSYKQYLWKLLGPYLNLMVSDQPTPKMHIDDSDEMLHFYDRFIINGKISSPDKDYRPLRQYPLFKSEKKTYVFMDFRFFVDKFYQGFLFDFAAITKISYDKLKTDMGNEFSEHVLFYMVMSKCFSNYGSTRLTGDEIRAKIGSGEPDYYIRNGSEIFLFEFKDNLIPADIKYAGEAEKIKNGILERMEKNSDGKRKGITQLMNSIRDIGSGLYNEKAVDHAQGNEIQIYPIIVHSDITLESCGVNYFLNKRMMSRVREFRPSNLAIRNLVMINIDTLIKLQDYFKAGKLDLGDCINNYINYISTDDPQTATFPFDEFVKYYFVEKNKEGLGNPQDFTAIITSFTISQ